MIQIALHLIRLSTVVAGVLLICLAFASLAYALKWSTNADRTFSCFSVGEGFFYFGMITSPDAMHSLEVRFRLFDDLPHWTLLWNDREYGTELRVRKYNAARATAHGDYSSPHAFWQVGRDAKTGRLIYCDVMALGCRVSAIKGIPYGDLSTRSLAFAETRFQQFELQLPWWMPLLIGLVMLFPSLTHRYRKRRSSIYVVSGRCRNCGYDLRATPDPAGPRLSRCPECGREAAARGAVNLDR